MEIEANIYPSVICLGLRLQLFRWHTHLLSIENLQPLGQCGHKTGLQLQAILLTAS